MKRLILAGLAVVAGAVIAAPAQAAPLPDNCTKVQGTVTCTTTDGPGKNQGGVGTVTETETQGNTTNKSPEESQDLEDSETCRPPSSAVWGADCS
jgi:hypothetical protein